MARALKDTLKYSLKHSSKYMLCGAFAFLTWESQLMAGSVEAKKDNVQVLATTEKDAQVVATLKKGDVVNSEERKGMYWQVKLPDGKAGYVSVMAVKIKPSETGGLGSAIRDAVKEGRQGGDQAGARSRSAVMGVRGLDENNTAQAGSVRPDLRAVYKMEDFSVSEGLIDRQSDIVNNDIMSRSRRK